MRKLAKIITTTLVLALILTSFINAADKNLPNSKLPYEQVEKNLLIGLESDNFGLRLSSAHMLGEIKSYKAVNSLSKMLRTDKDEKARLVAALALLKIGSERSIYVVKDGMAMNENEKVRSMCQHLYKAHLVSTFQGLEQDRQALFSYIFSDPSK